MQVSAQIAPGVAGIGTITISRNGRPQIVKTIPQGLELFSKKRILDTIVLEKGLNRIEVTATDATGKHTSKPESVRVTSNRATVAQPVLHLVFVSPTNSLFFVKAATELERALQMTTNSYIAKIVRHDIRLADFNSRIRTLSSEIAPSDLAVVILNGQIVRQEAGPLNARFADADKSSDEPPSLADALSSLARIPATKTFFAFDLASGVGDTVASRKVEDLAAFDRFVRASGSVVAIRIAGGDPSEALIHAMADLLSDWRENGDGALSVSAWVQAIRAQLTKRDAAAGEESTSFFRPLLSGEDFAIGRSRELLATERSTETTHVLVAAACADGSHPCQKPLLPGMRVRVEFDARNSCLDFKRRYGLGQGAQRFFGAVAVIEKPFFERDVGPWSPYRLTATETRPSVYRHRTHMTRYGTLNERTTA